MWQLVRNYLARLGILVLCWFETIGTANPPFPFGSMALVGSVV